MCAPVGCICVSAGDADFAANDDVRTVAAGKDTRVATGGGDALADGSVFNVAASDDDENDGDDDDEDDGDGHDDDDDDDDDGDDDRVEEGGGA
jgi:hypothetical protein